MSRCFYCTQPMWSHAEKVSKDALRVRFGIVKGSYRSKRLLRWRQATREHLHRRCEGGSNHRKNIVKACAYCNSNRNEATPKAHKMAMMDMVTANEHPCQQINALQTRPTENIK